MCSYWFWTNKSVNYSQGLMGAIKSSAKYDKSVLRMNGEVPFPPPARPTTSLGPEY